MPGPRTYADVPLPKTPYGEQLYSRGRELVAAGVHLDALVWDADEVLWDWVMSVASVVRYLPRVMRTRSLLSHSEFLRLKPGVFELLWGMHHASLERDLDPYMRIWTAGYTWRLWRIAKDLPGFTQLIGPPASVAAGPSSFAGHPRIMTRADTVAAIIQLVAPESRPWLDALPQRTRRVLLTSIQQPRGHAGLKIPELAQLLGKSAFDTARVLIDDARKNVSRFAATGRPAVRPNHPAPNILRGRLPNTVWRQPERRLNAVLGDIATPLADTLHDLAMEGFSNSRAIEVHALGTQPHPTLAFTLDVPGAIIDAEWVAPMKALKAALTPGKI